ncbi:unnamed protein product [Leptosia nina]|uniref:NHR domain-containing protein n=1 Tax=Leptosia nina TaxID=320188 RepID=A0AAV1K2V2_9NEOP
MRFHRRCGDRVSLLNGKTTAIRNFVEFNHGLIFSADPLTDDVIFEVCIDRKVNVWNGSLEIGVTTLDPESMELPATATKLRNTAWIMSGSSVVKDGVTIINSYGPKLDSLHESDCLGVMRTSKGELMFYVNGRCLGCAAKDMPPRLFAVIDLYGQCVQVSIMRTNTMRTIIENTLDQIEEDPNNDDTVTSGEFELSSETPHNKPCREVLVPITTEGACALVAQDRLRFHPRCGILVKLSNNNKSAERSRPLDDYNNGVVMTHRPLYDNELFEIRIDRLVDKWSGSIEVGVSTHNPATVRFPSTMTNMDSGTIMMSGCKVLLNGQGTCVAYGNFNLDELREGDTVGMMRNSSGKLHYFINGIDQGVAADKVEPQVWGVVDLYGMTVKVSIVDPCEVITSNMSNLPCVSNQPDVPAPVPAAAGRYRPQMDEDTLLFHSLRDSYVVIINDGKTAHRPNAFELFNNGIVMTNRTLRTNELFQVRLELVIPKWAGSVEIGVTQYSSNDIKMHFKMSNAKAGTWVMAGEDVLRDGSVIIPKYVRNLNRLCEGDTVGVMRKDMGILHFFVNGVDQGPAAFNIPEHVFGVLDLYGRVAQATIVDTYVPSTAFSPESPNSIDSTATVYPEMCFHRVHGRNARLSRTRLTASRSAVYSEFNDAVLFSSRPLRECDMFELRIDSMVDCWIGSLEIGVTAIRPDDLEECALAGTATDLSYDTYILSGSAMMKDGECVRSGYALDLDTLSVGSRVGVMWHADRSLHYYLDGMDMGKAWYVPHLNIYAVVDLYGQCTQVTILQNEERMFNYNGCPLSDNPFFGLPRLLATPPPPYWSFSEYYGDNIRLSHEYSVAKRMTLDPTGALLFSSGHLAVGEIFEIKITQCDDSFAGGFRMGVTDVNILNAHVNRSLPPSIVHLPHYTAYIDGKYMKYSKAGSRERDWRAVSPSFEWLRPGDRVGLKKSADGRVFVYYNCEQLDTAFEHVPDKVYVAMELYGCVCKIQAVKRDSVAVPPQTIPNDSSLYIEPTTEVAVEVYENANESEATTTQRRREPAPALPYTFHYLHGDNVELCSSDTVAIRTSGYNHGVAVVSQPLRRGQSFMFRIDKVVDEWEGSVGIGAVATLPADNLPFVAHSLDPPVWLLTADLLYDGTYLRSPMAFNLEQAAVGSILTLHFRFGGELVVELDGKSLGVIGSVPRLDAHVYPLLDLYGRVSQVSALLHPYSMARGTSLDLPIIVESVVELELEPRNASDIRFRRSLSQRDLPDHFGDTEPTHGSEVSRELRRESLSTYNFELTETERLLCDTNIRHNDRYPEASDVDDLDEEVSDALAPEPTNLPDVTEERFQNGAESISPENLAYLNRILGLERECEASLEAEWGAGCEHLHLVLKFWNHLVLPHPELRRAVSWGQIKCHCSACVPDSDQPFAGWVRIERIDGVGAAMRGFWHIARATLAAAQARSERGPARRPRHLAPAPLAAPTDIWLDEEGKPHRTALALEIDIEGDEADEDRLLAFLVHVRPSSAPDE